MPYTTTLACPPLEFSPEVPVIYTEYSFDAVLRSPIWYLIRATPSNEYLTAVVPHQNPGCTAQSEIWNFNSPVEALHLNWVS